jgi:hypothetical protein
MAASTAKTTQLTKFDSGGEAAANYIPDGYIKTVEKIWLDSYVFTSAIPSLCTLSIAKIPSNKKITSIDLYFPLLSTGASGTGTTISIGIASNTGKFLNTGEAHATVYTLSANQNLGYVTTSNPTTIVLTFDRIATTTTAGTITTEVRYT